MKQLLEWLLIVNVLGLFVIGVVALAIYLLASIPLWITGLVIINIAAVFVWLIFAA